MALFTGTHINRIDRKGRVSVPAAFRSALLKEDARVIAAFPSFTTRAIEACSAAILEELAEGSFSVYNFFGPNPDNLATQIFEFTEQMEWDPEGRVILPASFIAHCGIGEQVAFVGKGRFFQIWEPEALKAQRAADAALIAQNPPQMRPRPQVTP